MPINSGEITEQTISSNKYHTSLKDDYILFQRENKIVCLWALLTITFKMENEIYT